MCRTTKRILFCNGLPCQKKSFFSEVENPKKDFVGHFIAEQKGQGLSYDWSAYKGSLVTPYKKLKRAFKFRFVEFVDECTSDVFYDKLASTQYSTVILFSHCIKNGTKDEEIECFDRMVTSAELLEKIPETAGRIYDFSVCCPLWLAVEGRIKKPQSIYATSKVPIPLPTWIVIYFETFKNMVVHKMDFNSAFHETIRLSFNKVKHLIHGT